MNGQPEEKPLQIESPEPGATNWAMFCHLSALSSYLGIPFGHLLGPLILWLLKREQYPLVDDQGREALNFQISVSIYALVALALTFVLIGFLLLIPLILFHFIFTIVAAVKASSGERYRYPLTLRLIK